RACFRDRSRLWDSSRANGARVRAVHDHQKAGYGPGTGRLPNDRFRARRKAVGHQQLRPGRELPCRASRRRERIRCIMIRPDPVVSIVDDEPAVLKAVARLMRSVGLKAATFASPKDFLERYSPDTHGCIILDIAMPGLNGLELQRALARDGIAPPIIFLTGRADIPMSVRAMKQGAVDLLTKPVNDEDLIKAVRNAIARDRDAWQ